jgi:anaerobic ribonucleoside-triphosphate reductase activating protein
MLKYVGYDIVFQEVPGETSLAIWISGCTIRCRDCNQRYLWEDKGTPLTIEAIEELLNLERGVTVLLLMGGEHDIDALTGLFMYFHKKIKTAWYSGLDMIPKDKLGILEHLDLIKVGHYDHELGGLDSPTTNQRLYQYSKYYSDFTIGKGWRDITYRLQKK